MNESEFLQRWHNEQAIYKAWGCYVVDFISAALVDEMHKDLKKFLKIPASSRVKENDSLVDKAFYRDKNYENPYEDIEDKVGARFVVMLVSDVNDICEIIEKAQQDGKWHANKCRDFNEERKLFPTIFTYQSHHFIVRSNCDLTYQGVEIKENTPCEVQIRSLLQHAYAELTHEVTYKKKTVLDPHVGRTIAKTMAFIETTDDFFKEVTEKTANKPMVVLECFLDELFESLTGKKPAKLKSSLFIYDTFSELIDENLPEKINRFISQTPGLDELISEGKKRNIFYNQSVIIFVYWLVHKRRATVERDWPLDWQLASDIALDLNVSLNRHT
jgi:ppGpp synthetase/RelA/SpoT-type nucleotidyltranferase